MNRDGNFHCPICQCAWDVHWTASELCSQQRQAVARIYDLSMACSMGLDVVNQILNGRTAWPETFLKMIADRMERALKGNK